MACHRNTSKLQLVWSQPIPIVQTTPRNRFIISSKVVWSKRLLFVNQSAVVKILFAYAWSYFRELKCNCSALTPPQHLAVQWPKVHPHTPTKSTFDRKDIAWRFRFFREGKYSGNEWTCTICAFLAMMIHWVLRSLRGCNVLLIVFAIDVKPAPWRVASKVTCAMELLWWNEIAIGKNSMHSSIWETGDAKSRSSGLWRDSFLVGFLKQDTNRSSESGFKSKAFSKIWKHPKIIQKPMTNRPERVRITCLFLSRFYIILPIASGSGSVLFAFLEALSAVFPSLGAPTNSPQRSELDWWPAGTTHALRAPDSPAQKRCSSNLYTKWKYRPRNVQFRKSYFSSSSFKKLWFNTAVLSQTPNSPCGVLPIASCRCATAMRPRPAQPCAKDGATGALDMV